jgi:UDP-N-acetylmuramate dehydrogenase
VLDPADRDTYSTGSFFTNPIVPADVAAGLPDSAPRYPAGKDGLVKLSAAWLIDQAGFAKGYGLGEGSVSGGRASLSTKHTLAITNRGAASAEDMLAVAREVRAGVVGRFGIELHPEPLLIGLTLKRCPLRLLTAASCPSPSPPAARRTFAAIPSTAEAQPARAR